MNRSGLIAIGQILVMLLLSGGAWASAYKTVTPVQLKAILPDKDFFLLDVHIPEQNHIAGTDAFIDFRKIRQQSDLLPDDKNTKIIVYCVGGQMSRQAALELIDLGYTQVYDLLGGTWAFRQLPE